MMPFYNILQNRKKKQTCYRRVANIETHVNLNQIFQVKEVNERMSPPSGY